MSSTFRTRLQPPGGLIPPGTKTVTGPYGSETITIPSNMFDDFCEDYTSSHMNSFRCSKTTIQGSVITGEYDGFWGHVSFNNVPSGLHSNLVNYKLDSTPNDGYLATATLAKTNPNIANMSIPNSLFELRELPSLVKQFGKEALDIVSNNISLKNLAHLNLMASFGVAPMISDYETLMSFQKNVSNRLRNMHDVRKFGGITKTKRLGKYDSTDNWESYFWDGPIFFVYTLTQETSVEVWGSTKWTLSPNYSGDLYTDHTSNRDNLSDHLSKLIGLTGKQVSADEVNAFRTAYGLYSYGINDLWNILPFSWLTDYFSNIGDVVDANSNQLGMEPTAACLMKRSTVKRHHPGANQDGVYLSPGKFEGVLKTRIPIDIPSARSNITMKVPAVTQHQYSILGSLALSFFPRSKGGASSNPYLSWAHRVIAGVKQL